MAEYIESEFNPCDVCEAMKCNICVLHELAIKFAKQPAADVAPVVHGRWDGEKDHGDFREVKCTACGGILLVKWSTRLSEYRYCPNCGARMDGE